MVRGYFRMDSRGNENESLEFISRVLTEMVTAVNSQCSYPWVDQGFGEKQSQLGRFSVDIVNYLVFSELNERIRAVSDWESRIVRGIQEDVECFADEMTMGYANDGSVSIERTSSRQYGDNPTSKAANRFSNCRQTVLR